MILEPEKFHQFERNGWESIPEGYHHAFGRLTTQAIGPLLEAIRLRNKMSFLDMACGPGYLAAAAAARGATVLGVDFSSAMVHQAQSLHPGIDFREGNAEQLPLGAGLFDAVAMNFGILHLGQPEKALAEACRVLRPGGRFAFSVWAPPEQTIGFGIVLHAVERFGEPRVELPEGPPFFLFSDPSECERGLLAAGFESPSVTAIKQTWQLPAGDGLFDVMKDCTVRTAGLLRAQKPVVLEKIRAAMHEDVAAYTHGEHVELPMPALIACGTKPK